MNEQLIQEAIHTSVAKAILEGLDTSARDAILQKSISKALGDYQFRHAVENVVADKAKAVAAELVESEEWTQRIEEAIRAGFEDYVKDLRKATSKVMAMALNGEEGESYSSQRAGALLKCWPKGSKE
jgi:hypothetical protein